MSSLLWFVGIENTATFSLLSEKTLQEQGHRRLKLFEEKNNKILIEEPVQ